MTQFTTTPVRRAGGDPDVYTALLAAAFLVLTFGVVMLALKNVEHSAPGPNQTGGMFTLVQ